MNLEGKVALVTGAGKRVGQAIAMALAERGTALAIHYRSSRSGAEEAAARIVERGGRAQIFRAELESVAEIEQMIGSVLEAYGHLDVLVNSASVFYRKPLEELTER
ncbi:MAG TPA: SDR family NAD(P)-dependent oxidoreductase, partial [Candidatus Binataceae bacterium]|nr:SDR family NAD(P)-dependent oxidoreductase [Candidatus Binataceae bacterium]